MKLGLVLAGGGGKGGYEIGVWKYLKEIGLNKKISVISGTSVGGLNAVLMGTVDYKTAEHIWLNEIENRILDKESSENKKAALFSRDGLLEIIDKFVPLEKLKKNEKSIYVTCFRKEGLEPDYFKLNEHKISDIKKMLCATSAIPVAFQSEEIFGKNYVDGGVKDNVPLQPLIDEKCTHALIINLDTDSHKSYGGFDINNVIQLHPTSKLGGLFSGTMDFSRERTQKRIELGYNDCKNSNEAKINSLLEDDEMVNKINDMNDDKILKETLKILSVHPKFVGQIQCNMNKESKTLGGPLGWNELAKFGGWIFQQNKILKQVRLLDPFNNRKAWGPYQKMVNICRDFLIQNVNLIIPSTSDIESRLSELNNLFEKKLISESDFEKRKAEILKEI